MQANGGLGKFAMGINNDAGDTSDWQFSKLYIWNKWISDSNFELVAKQLNTMLRATNYDSYSLGCTQCPLNSISMPASASATGCECLLGFTLVAAVCAPCPAGSYKNATGNIACDLCPAHATSATGQSARSGCQCGPGYSGPIGGECTACAADTFKACSGSAGCVACPPSAQSPESSAVSTACRCNVGYSGTNGGACTACVAGSFKTDVRPAACAPCPADSVSLAGSSNRTTCLCAPGHTGADGGECTACEAGTFKALPGSHPWAFAPKDLFNAFWSVLQRFHYIMHLRNSCCCNNHHASFLCFSDLKC